MALGLTLGIGRSMRIKRSPSLDILTSNLRTPRGYYQANSHLKATGFLTSKGGYVIHPQKLPNYVVPDSTGFKPKPYLSHMAIKATNPAESTTKYMLGTVNSSYTSLGGTSHRNVYRRTFGYDYRGFMSNQGCRLKKSYNLHNLGSVTSIRQYSTVNASIENKSKKMLFYLTGLVFGMVGLSYAAVPLYRRFCQATGYGGTIQRRESVEEKIARHAKDGTTTSREIVVQFNADVSDGMPWKFTATQREVRVKPGESALAFYTAENRSSNPITGMSTYNVTPMKAAVYFNKIQCFCFEEQKLLPGEQIDMPVFFYIDPEFETDPKMDGINNIILSYTFFKVSGDK